VTSHILEETVDSHSATGPALAAAITRAASKQTYYTIRCLVDWPLVDDAYRAYAYFRWVDDRLDQGTRPLAARLAFIERQQALAAALYRGESPAGLIPEERLLADLLRRPDARDGGLRAYVDNMMAVMAFDAGRRGRLISQQELDDYTHWLAVAVTEALHYFIGHDAAAPHGEIRYVAVTGAHITHMLRDALEDAEAGYFNIPREVAAAHRIDPWDVASPAYRDWVRERVRDARTSFSTGRDYLAQVACLRCRLAGYAYIRRFEVVLDGIERDGCLLRAAYPERKRPARGAEMMGWALWMALKQRAPGYGAPALPAR
jgi:phytoene/squalene synthetase